MAVNATRTDEQIQTVSKRKTLARMFCYLLAYQKQVVTVLLIMLASVVITLIDPLMTDGDRCLYCGSGLEWIKKAWHRGGAFESDTCPACQNKNVYYGKSIQ